MVGLWEKVRIPPAQVQRLFEVGSDGLEIIRFPGLGPDLIGQGCITLVLGLKGGRNAGGPFVIAPGDARNRAG